MKPGSLLGARYDLVIHIGEVGGVRDLVTAVPEVARDGVEDDHTSGAHWAPFFRADIISP